VWTKKADNLERDPVPYIDLRYLRGIPVMPPVGNQGRSGSCTSWATVFGMKSYQEALDQRWVPSAPSKQFSPAFTWHQLNNGQNKGTSIAATLKILKEQGAVTLKTLPFSDKVLKSEITTEMRAEAERYRIADFRRLTTLEDIKTQLRPRP